MARIHPYAKTSDLTNKQIQNLYKAIKYIAFSSLLTWLKKNKISIPTDVKKNKPAKTKVPFTFIVYDMERDPKNNIITSEKIGGRMTYYVKKLQKR